MKTVVSNCIGTDFAGIKVFTFPLKVSDLLTLHYVAVRGKDDEEGAVQRILNRGRINSIKEYILQGNMFFNTFILNWTNNDFTPKVSDNGNEISIPIVNVAAQVIDGQHRLAGLDEAMKSSEKVGDLKALISLCVHLGTKEAAKIFLNINTEQKPAPKSLIYDLFGDVESNEDHPIVRATDIAKELQNNIESPFYNLIKFPGAPRGAGVIDLSTVVSVLKECVKPDGPFANLRINEMNFQKQIIFNYLNAIKNFYDKRDIWNNKSKNPFIKAAGFVGAINCLTTTLLIKCAEQKSFKVDTFEQMLNIDSNNLLSIDNIKNLDGKTARKEVEKYLLSNLKNSMPEPNTYEF